ncbi:hypothetical protein AB0I24_15390 [Brachybacterium paraconglomeratum]
MGTRTYTRRFLAEVTETYTIAESDLTDEDRITLDASAEAGFAQSGDADEVLTGFDAGHEEITACEDRQLTIARIR